MSSHFERLGIDRLSVDERLELIEQIWDSLPQQVSIDELSPEQLEELKRRYADMIANPGRGRPYEEVLNELRARRGA